MDNSGALSIDSTRWFDYGSLYPGAARRSASLQVLIFYYVLHTLWRLSVVCQLWHVSISASACLPVVVNFR